MPQAGTRQRDGAACGRSGGRAPDAGWAAAAARGDVAVCRYFAGSANRCAQGRAQMADRRARPRAGARGAGDAGGRAGKAAAFTIAGHFKSLARSHAATRGGARARAQDAARSERFRALTLEIARWLEAGQWRRPQGDLVRDRGDVPIEVSAADQLTRRFKKIRKQGKMLTRLDARRRHKLRIRAKEVRYASELLARLFPGTKASKSREKFVRVLEALQDEL